MLICDFETNNHAEDCRVWAWAAYDVYTNKAYRGLTIDTFMDFIFRNPQKLYFHNLKFDGEFIVIWLLKHGFIWQEEKGKDVFSTSITGEGVWYSINIWHNDKCIIIKDSLKVIGLKVKNIPKAYDLEEEKGEIEYNKYRCEGYLPTMDEWKYIYHDVSIVAKAMIKIREQGLPKDTQASNAMYDYKQTIGKENFDYWFPKLEFDGDIRRSYKGGFVYVNPIHQNKVIGKGISLDVNSMYPYVMYNKKLPYGPGRRFEGEPDIEKGLFIITMSCGLELKPGKLPSVILRNGYMQSNNEYIETTDGDIVSLTLTSIDYNLMYENYYVYEETFFGGWYFKSSDIMFKRYIDKWYGLKEEATKTGNKGIRSICKIMLNSLYGKFGLNPKLKTKEPYLEGDKLQFKILQERLRDPIYVPIAAFVTSYAREIIIKSAQVFGDNFVYSDTDCLKILFKNPDKENFEEDFKYELSKIKIDDYELGAFKKEELFYRARFIRTKCYIEELKDKELVIKCSGMPESCYSMVTFENFVINTVYEGKLLPKHVNGGIVLEDTTFKILP